MKKITIISTLFLLVAFCGVQFAHAESDKDSDHDSSAKKYIDLRIDPSKYTKENPLRVMFLGDSITQGGGEDSYPGYGGYRGFIQKLFPEYDLKHFKIVGAYDVPQYGPNPPLSDLQSAIGGAGWSPDYTYMFGSIADAWNASKNLKPQLIFANGGGNGLTLFETVEHDNAAALKLMRQIYSDDPGVCIVLGSYIPSGPGYSFIPGLDFDTELTQMNTGLKKDVYGVLKAEGKCIFWADINAAFKKAMAKGIQVLGPVSGTHPIKAGYKIMAETWLSDSNVFK